MSLNENAGDDNDFDSLFKTGVQPVSIHTDNSGEVNENQPLTEQKTIIINNDKTQQPRHVGPEEMFGGPLIKNELPNLNAVFVETSENDINVARDLLDVQKSIQLANGVAREDAELIESISPGFSEKQPIGFYTVDKSKNQLTETISTLDKELDIRISTVAKKTTDYLDEIHSKFTPILQAIERNALDKITSLQMEVQDLSLACGSKTTKLSNGLSLNDVLEYNVGRCGDSEKSDEDIEKFPESIKEQFGKIAKLFLDGSSFKYKLGTLYYSQLYSHNGLYLPIGNSGYRSSNNFYVELLDKAPFVKDIDKSLNFNPNSASYVNTLYLHTALSCSDAMVTQVKKLCGFLSAIISSLPEQKEIIKESLSGEKLNKSQQLDVIQKHSSANARDALLILNSISFLEDFICHLTALRNIYKAISSEVSELDISTEGIFDLFNKKKNSKNLEAEKIKERNKKKSEDFKNALNERAAATQKAKFHNEDLKDQITRFSDLSEKIKLSEVESVTITLKVSDGISSIPQYTESLTTYLFLLKGIEGCYKKLPSILDKATILVKDFIKNPKDTPDKFITKAAQIYYELNNSTSNIFGSKGIVKSPIDKYGRSSFKDKNSVFEFLLFQNYETLTTDKNKLGSVQKAKELIYNHKYSFNLFPSYRILKNEKDVSKTFSSSKEEAIKLMAASMEIASTLLNIRSLHYFEEGSGSLNLYSKASALYELGESVEDIEDDEIMAGEVELIEFMYEAVGNLASWVEDHHAVKDERNTYETTVSLIESIEVTL